MRTCVCVYIYIGTRGIFPGGRFGVKGNSPLKCIYIICIRGDGLGSIYSIYAGEGRFYSPVPTCAAHGTRGRRDVETKSYVQ